MCARNDIDDQKCRDYTNLIIKMLHGIHFVIQLKVEILFFIEFVDLFFVNIDNLKIEIIKPFFYISETTLKSIDNEKILANIQIDQKLIETFLGNFPLSDLNVSQRSYHLKLNDNIIAQVTRQWHFTRG
jgi:hypothetical protein